MRKLGTLPQTSRANSVKWHSTHNKRESSTAIAIFSRVCVWVQKKNVRGFTATPSRFANAWVSAWVCSLACVWGGVCVCILNPPARSWDIWGRLHRKLLKKPVHTHRQYTGIVVYIHIYICTCMYIYIYIYIDVYVSVYTGVYVYICINLRKYIYMCMYIDVYIYVRIYICI